MCLVKYFNCNINGLLRTRNDIQKKNTSTSKNLFKLASRQNFLGNCPIPEDQIMDIDSTFDQIDSNTASSTDQDWHIPKVEFNQSSQDSSALKRFVSFQMSLCVLACSFFIVYTKQRRIKHSLNFITISSERAIFIFRSSVILLCFRPMRLPPNTITRVSAQREYHMICFGIYLA